MHTMTKPAVSIIMPAYNAGRYIAEAIASVLNQSFIYFELIIINDGSTDDTSEVIASFDDNRIYIINQERQGVAASLNKGLAAAKGAYIARFDADDICEPERIEKQYSFFQQYPEYVIVGSDAEYIMEDGRHLFHFSCIAHTDEEIRQQLYVYCPFIHSSVMYSCEAVRELGGYSVHAHNFEDYLLWTQLAMKGKLYNLSERLIKVRFNPSSVTIDEKWRGSRFRKIKKDSILKGSISKEEGDMLLAILKSQDVQHIREGAYHALCGKKFLVNNYQPVKAREHIGKAIRSNPFRFDNYVLLTISYLPQTFIGWLHRRNPLKR